MTNIATRRLHAPRRERGVALVVALILLLVATLIGLAASRGTVLQERMSANSYDRSMAFQRSESALRAAEVEITKNYQIAALNGIDCSVAACPVVPASAFNTTADAAWRDVAADYNVNTAMAPGTPQYHIAFMGTGRADNSLGTKENADSTNYGGSGSPDNVAYYRVTARSTAPSLLGGRSLVVLQTTVKRPY